MAIARIVTATRNSDGAKLASEGRRFIKARRMRGRIAVDVPRLSDVHPRAPRGVRGAEASELGPIRGTTVEIRTRCADKLHKNALRQATK